MKKQNKEYVITLTSKQDGTITYFTRMIPHWDYVDGQRIHTETIETTTKSKNARIFNDGITPGVSYREMLSWQPDWCKNYDVRIEEVMPAALKIRELAKPINKLISLVKTLDIQEYPDGIIDVPTRKKQKAVYDRIMKIVEDVNPAFIEILKTVE